MKSNRNYAIYPAQTNIELYEQMLELGFSNEAISRVNDAYLFSMDKVYALYRGSGKPFICHLVGTASLLVSAKQSLELILGALMHALYQNRVPFENFLEIEKRRVIVSEKFGPKVESLIFDYTNFENTNLTDVQLDNPNLKRDIVVLHLADHVEDLLGYSIFLHGNVDDLIDFKGSYLWRKSKYQNEKEAILKLAKHFKVDEWIETIDFWMNFDNYDKLPKNLKTGFSSSVNLLKNDFNKQ